MNEQSKIRFDAKELILKHLTAVRDAMRSQMDMYGRNATGKHSRDLHIEATIGYGLLWSPYWSWNVMETGRAGGKVPLGFRKIIYDWSIAKGINIAPVPYKREGDHKYTPEERGRMTFAYFVAKKIMKEGTSLFRSGVRQDIYSGVINSEVAALNTEIGEYLSSTIQNINKNA